MKTVLYGIPNCDTVKKARSWLEGHGVPYAFHNYKSDGIEPAMLRAWAGKAGWELLLNRNGTTFRKLPEQARAGLDETRALALMAAQPSMIKRPVLVRGDALVVGFNPEKYLFLTS